MWGKTEEIADLYGHLLSYTDNRSETSILETFNTEARGAENGSI